MSILARKFRITANPGSGYWHKPGTTTWEAQITVLANEGALEINIGRQFLHEQEAAKWRRDFMDLLSGVFTIEVVEKS